MPVIIEQYGLLLIILLVFFLLFWISFFLPLVFTVWFDGLLTVLLIFDFILFLCFSSGVYTFTCYRDGSYCLSTSVYRIPLSIFCWSHDREFLCLFDCLSWSFSYSSVKDSLAGCSNLGWQLLLLRVWKASSYALLTCRVLSAVSSAVSQIGLPFLMV